MVRALWLAVGALGVLATVLWATGRGPIAGPNRGPQDVTGPPLPIGPLRVVVLGTSLSASPQTWPDDLAKALSQCRKAPVTMLRVVGPGQGSAWGLGQIDRVRAARPDVILIEFAINDADLRDGVWRGVAKHQHLALIDALQTSLPAARLVLMTMGPAAGLRGWIRPFLASHYMQYQHLAEETGAGLVDIYPRWLALPREARGLGTDGLHPAPDLAEGVIVPALRDYLAAECAGVPS